MPQIQTTDTGHLMEGQSTKWRSQGEDNTADIRFYHQRKKRLRYLGHVLRIIADCQNKPYIRRQTTQSEGREDPYMRQDMNEIGLSWEEAQERSLDREDWRRCVAQCVFDTRWRKARQSSAHTITVTTWQRMDITFTTHNLSIGCEAAKGYSCQHGKLENRIRRGPSIGGSTYIGVA